MALGASWVSPAASRVFLGVSVLSLGWLLVLLDSSLVFLGASWVSLGYFLSAPKCFPHVPGCARVVLGIECSWLLLRNLSWDLPGAPRISPGSSLLLPGAARWCLGSPGGSCWLGG